MKICLISSTVLPCLPLDDPENGYNGLEQIVWSTAAGLARRGHDVLLVAPNGSKPPPGVTLHGTTRGESEEQAYSGYWNRLPEYQVVIDSSWSKWSYILKIEGKLAAPILGVVHAPIHTMYQSAPPVLFPCLVAISQDQSVAISEHLGVNSRVARNGIDIDFYQRRSVEKTGRYLYLARMSRIKGPHLAVDLARKLRFGLDLVGDETITGEPDLAQRLRAQAVNNIKYHGGCSRDQTVNWYSSAKAHLHTAREFREPAGLAPLEAQACGLPVLAFDNGAMRETVIHGMSGFVVKTMVDMEEFIRTDAVASLKPEDCRASAERYSLGQMIDAYEQLAIEAIDTGGW